MILDERLPLFDLKSNLIWKNRYDTEKKLAKRDEEAISCTDESRIKIEVEEVSNSCRNVRSRWLVAGTQKVDTTRGFQKLLINTDEYTKPQT